MNPLSRNPGSAPFIGPSPYSTKCVQAAKALERSHICAGSSGPSLLIYTHVRYVPYKECKYDITWATIPCDLLHMHSVILIRPDL